MCQVFVQVKQTSARRTSGKQDNACKNSFLDVIFLMRFFGKSKKLAYRTRTDIITNRDCRNQYGVENHRIDSKNDTACCPENNKAKKYLYNNSFVEQKKNLLKDALDSLSVAGFGFILVFALSYFLYSSSFRDFLYLALWGGAVSFDPINVVVPFLFWIIVNSFVWGITKLLVYFNIRENHLVAIECITVKSEGWETKIEYRIPPLWDDISNLVGMLLPVFALLVWPWYNGHFSGSVFGVTLLMIFVYLITKENKVCLF